MKKYLISLCIFSAIVGSQIWAENMVSQKDQSNKAPAAQQQDKPMVVSGKKTTINIKLPANATTGYQWYLTQYDEGLIRPKSYEYKVSESKKKLVGAGGVAVFKMQVSKRFKSVPQMQTISFSYARPWDLSDIARTKVITILSTGR